MARSALLLVLAAGLLTSSCGRQRPWNVVLFTFDTTRADFIGCYGKESAQTPHLDDLAAKGFLFENAMASNPVTQAAHSTILTGVYPMVHGVRDNLLFRLPEEQQTLAELLRDQGYATAAAVGGFPLVESFGSHQGFDFYDDDLGSESAHLRGLLGAQHRQTWYDERPAGHVNDAILPWLRQHMGGDRPFFAWLHYWDPHEPHIPPAPYDQLFAYDPYQGEIAYADQSLGALLAALEEGGELHRTLVVMVADHGESRMEHGEATHAYLAYGSTLHVPLIIKLPGDPATAGRRIAERVGTVDIVPTVLDLLGFAPGEHFQGRSLAPLMLGPESTAGDRVSYYSESLSPRLSHGVGELRALYRGPYKYIHGPRPELFDLREDPGELRDLSQDLPEERQQFEAELQSFLERHASADAAQAVHEVDDATRQRLEALGYLSTNEAETAAVSEVLSQDGAVPQDRVGDINLTSRLRNQMGAGRYRLALRTVEKLLQGDPENPFYRGRLAMAHLGLGQIEDAVRLVEQSELVSSANVQDFQAVAEALLERNEGEDPDRALALGKRLVAASETLGGHLFLADVYHRREDLGAFEAELNAALELDPDHRGALLLRAGYLKEGGDMAGAEAIYRRLLAAAPLDVGSMLGLAELLRETQRSAEALSHVRRAVRLAPGFCRAHVQRMEVLQDLQHEQEIQEVVEGLRATCQHNAAALQRADEILGGHADAGR